MHLWNQNNPIYKTPLRMTSVEYSRDASEDISPKIGNIFKNLHGANRNIYRALRNPLTNTNENF